MMEHNSVVKVTASHKAMYLLYVISSYIFLFYVGIFTLRIFIIISYLFRFSFLQK